MTEPTTDPTPEALLPCLCCGSRAIFGEVTDPDSENFGGIFIECTDCIITTDLRFSVKEDARPLLAEQWNSRPALDAAVERERERVAGSLVSHFLASNDAAFWDKYPRPWRVEEDWTCEITAASGGIVGKLPYPRDLDIAHAVVSTANSMPDNDAATEAEIEALLRGARP